jgi:hypothetical protein
MSQFLVIETPSFIFFACCVFAAQYENNLRSAKLPAASCKLTGGLIRIAPFIIACSHILFVSTAESNTTHTDPLACTSTVATSNG